MQRMRTIRRLPGGNILSFLSSSQPSWGGGGGGGSTGGERGTGLGQEPAPSGLPPREVADSHGGGAGALTGTTGPTQRAENDTCPLSEELP